MQTLKVLSFILSLTACTTSDDNGKIYLCDVGEIEKNTWARRDTEFFFMRSTRHLTSEPSKHVTSKKKPS